jgi:hypothetical protein
MTNLNTSEKIDILHANKWNRESSLVTTILLLTN